MVSQWVCLRVPLGVWHPQGVVYTLNYIEQSTPGYIPSSFENFNIQKTEHPQKCAFSTQLQLLSNLLSSFLFPNLIDDKKLPFEFRGNNLFTF